MIYSSSYPIVIRVQLPRRASQANGGVFVFGCAMMCELENTYDGVKSSVSETANGVNKDACIAAYADADLVLFPCKSNRTPAYRDWQFVLETVDDLPNMFAVNIPSDVFVLDYDPRNGNTHWKDWIKSLPESLPKTFNVNTPRGGWHMYFRKPRNIKLASRISEFKAIEIKQRKQYVNAAGSFYKGSDYEGWYEPVSLPIEIADAPDWLLDACKPIDKVMHEAAPGVKLDEDAAKTKFIVFLQDVDTAESAYNIACEGKDLGLSPEVIAYLMTEYVNPRWDSPTDFPTLLAKAKNAWQYSQNAPGARNYSHDFDNAEIPDVFSMGGFVTPSIESIESNNGFHFDDELIQWELDTIKGVQITKPTMGNVICYFRLHQWRIVGGGTIENPIHHLIRFNAFINKIEFTRRAPWHGEFDVDRQYWRDSDAVMLKAYLQQNQAFSVGTPVIEEAVSVIAHRRAYHPVREYLNSLRWDGAPRLDNMLRDYAGAQDNEYVREVSKNVILAAVARVFNPGCQHDTVVILEGAQGSGKTNFVRTLGGEWGAEMTIANNTKDNIHKMLGKWIIELPEMEFTRHADVKAIRAFLSTSIDTDRLSYERHAQSIPRQSVFIGTMNPEENGYLRDTTGNRRYLPITTSEINVPGLAAVRDQIFAEAVTRFKNGEKHYTDDVELIKRNCAEQKNRLFVDAWEDVIAIGLKQSDELYFTNTEIAERILFLPKARIDQAILFRITGVMKKLGYTKIKKYHSGYKTIIAQWCMDGGLHEVW